MNTQDVNIYRAAEKHLWDHYRVSPLEHEVPLSPGGRRVRVFEIGQGDPVLFIHGSPTAGSKWIPLAARLPDFRCLILDRPGCGLSDPMDYNGSDLRVLMVDLICQVLDHFHLPRVRMVASSLGGMIAFYFAQAHPERVSRLVLEGCPAFVQGFRLPFYNVYSSLVSLITRKPLRSLPAFRHMGHAASIDSGRFETEVLACRDALLRYTDTSRNESALERHILPRMKQYRYNETLLRQIAMPSLYLWGEADPFGGVDLGRRMAAAQPDALIKSFPASGHLPWLDDVDTHARLIRAFLQGESIQAG